jgi:hypothetical protein
MKLRLIGQLVGLGAALVLVALAVGNQEQSGWAQDCTIIVSPGRSINQAINNASPGAVICLRAGTWNEAILISKPVTIIGAGQDSTFIIGNNDSHGITFDPSMIPNATVIIKKLTVGHFIQGIGAGNNRKAYVVIENVTTQYNKAGLAIGEHCVVLPPGTPGAGNVACTETHLWIRNNIIQNNTFGIWLGGTHLPVIEECVNNIFKDNTSDFNSEYVKNKCSS